MPKTKWHLSGRGSSSLEVRAVWFRSRLDRGTSKCSCVSRWDNARFKWYSIVLFLDHHLEAISWWLLYTRGRTPKVDKNDSKRVIHKQNSKKRWTQSSSKFKLNTRSITRINTVYLSRSLLWVLSSTPLPRLFHLKYLSCWSLRRGVVKALRAGASMGR